MYEEFNEKIARIGVAKDNIKTSLVNKGLSPSDNIEDYATLIDSIEQGSGSGDVKLFETIEEMQADLTAKENGLALIYRDVLENMNYNTQVQEIYLPETVILPEPVESSSSIRLKAVDTSNYMQCSGSLSATRFYISIRIGFTTQNNLTILYNSSDGITYTRNANTPSKFNFQFLVTGYNETYFPSLAGYFIKVNNPVFEGLYKAQSEINYERIKGYRLSYNDGVLSYSEEQEPRNDAIKLAVKNIATHAYGSQPTKLLCAVLFIKENTAWIAFNKMSPNNGGLTTKEIDGILNINSLAYVDGTASYQYLYQYDLSNNTFSIYKSYSSSGSTVKTYDTGLELNGLLCVPLLYSATTNEIESETWSSDTYPVFITGEGKSLYHDFMEDIVYRVAPTQLTLINPAKLIKDEIAYGNGQVVEGTLEEVEITQEDYQQAQEQINDLFGEEETE